MITIAQHQEHLDRLGLTTLAGVKAFSGDLVKDHKGRRDVFRIPLPGGGTLYLKRIWQPHKKDGLRSRLMHGQVWSIAREEWKSSLALQRAGLRTAEHIAYGEDCGPLWERFSFIITGAAPGRPLDQFLRECRDSAERQLVFDALAREIWKLHDAGLSTPDLFTRHIFVEGTRFCFIDMARLDRTAHRARDLAALNITAPLRFVTGDERKRFLEIYGMPGLCADVQRRTAYLLKRRRKFQDFLRNNEPNVK